VLEMDNRKDDWAALCPAGQQLIQPADGESPFPAGSRETIRPESHKPSDGFTDESPDGHTQLRRRSIGCRESTPSRATGFAESAAHREYNYTWPQDPREDRRGQEPLHSSETMEEDRYKKASKHGDSRDINRTVDHLMAVLRPDRCGPYGFSGGITGCDHQCRHRPEQCFGRRCGTFPLDKTATDLLTSVSRTPIIRLDQQAFDILFP
jgi:hypothetical protein